MENTCRKKVLTPIAFDFLETLTYRIQEDFDEVIGEDTDKKQFIKALMHIFTPLLNTKVDTVDRFKRILQIAVETALRIWQGQK